MTVDPIREQAIDVDSIYWAVSINGVNLPFEKRQSIKSIQFTETCKGSDSVTISISDPDMEFIQDDIYLEDTPMSIDMLFNGSDFKTNFYGYISTIDVDFPEDGSPALELYCLDKTHLMQRVKNTQTWDNVRSIDVVQEKCKGYGFKLVYSEDYEYLKEDSISQSNQTDIEFLESLANNERELFVAKLVGDTFFYIRLGLLADPVAQLYYRYDAKHNNVKSFQASIDKETRQVDVKYADITTATKDVDCYFANQMTVALQTQGYPVAVSSVGYGSTPYDDTAAQKNKSKSRDTNKAEREYREVEYNTLRGDAVLLPMAELLPIRSMNTINFSGIGKYLSGLYFVEGVSRILDCESGYSQTLTLIKTGFGKSMKPIVVSDEIATSTQSGEYSVGDVIRFKSDSAKYAHASAGVSVPSWVRAKTWKVTQVDTSGRCVLLGEINSWVYMNDIEKA